VKQFKELGSDRSVNEEWSLVGWSAVVTSNYRHFGGMYCLFLQHLAVLGVWHSWRFESLDYGKQALCKVFLKFILLLHIIKCWYNTPLQVLTAAPALHSLIVRNRNKDVDEILEFLFQKPLDLKGLILELCYLGEDNTGFLASIVALYPDLEVLLLERCYPLTSDDYCLIPRLKKLSELNISYCQVDCVCVKLLRDACLRTWST
jgi:hypothetical protein